MATHPIDVSPWLKGGVFPPVWVGFRQYIDRWGLARLRTRAAGACRGGKHARGDQSCLTDDYFA
jgi:hypothetical protein